MVDLLRFVIAGSVDDGKSTLVGRMLHDAGVLSEDHIEALAKLARTDGGRLDLSLVTDGLKSEREQGVTIDVAYRYFTTAKRRFIVIDAPGHEQYTRNMVTGASHADLAIVLVDAKLGLLTQTRRHTFICAILGIPRLIVALNKMDLVGYSRERFEEIREAFEEFAARLPVKNLTFVPLNALNGDNIVNRSTNMPWYDGQPLLDLLETVYVGSDRNLVDLRFSVQTVVRAEGDRWYGGRIGSGVVKVGDEIVILPSHRRSRVRAIALHEKRLPAAFAPLSVAINLEDDIDIGRGALIAHPRNAPRAARSLEALVVWMQPQPLRLGQVYMLKLGSSWVRASCAHVEYRVDPTTLHHEASHEIGLNEIGRVGFTLFEERFIDSYTSNRATGAFIVVDPVTNATAGAGMIVDREADSARGGRDDLAPDNIVPRSGKVSESRRAAILGQQPVTFWLTGLSGAGKSTLAIELEQALVEAGRACYMLDGDNVRGGLNRDLGFGPDDRHENIRRIAEVARLMNDAGLIVITAFISPYRADRTMAREIIGTERYLEIYVEASLEVCERRDPKGLYRKARRGEIADFTGISAPYEVPDAPAVRVDTANGSVEQCADALFQIAISKVTRDTSARPPR